MVPDLDPDKPDPDLDKPDIVLDSVLDMRNHYKTGEFLINSGGEEYNFDFSYTDDNDTHTKFLNSAQGIDNTINYAVAFDDSVSMSEYGSFAKTFSASKTVTWSISGGVDSDKFQVDSNTGSLSFKEKPDFENPNDSDLVSVPNGTLVENIFLKSNDKNSEKNAYLGNAGIFIINKGLLDRLKAPKEKDSKSVFHYIVKTVFELKINIYSYNTTEYIKDMGTPYRLKIVEEDLSKEKVNRKNYKNIQKAFDHRAKMNGLSSKGEWSENLEKEAAA